MHPDTPPHHQHPPTEPPAAPLVEQQPVAPPPPPPHKRTVGSVIQAIFSFWLVSWVILPVVLVLILHNYVFSAYHVVGTSMLPTLQDANYLIISKVDRTQALLTHKDYIPGRGQIVVFHYPKQPDLDFVKRVVGLPGDRVVIQNCQVRVYNNQNPNGLNPDSTHSIDGTCTESDSVETIVPPGNIFVLGDNRTPGGSSDSREWGLLPSSDIVGNAVLRLYPFNEIKIF